MLLVDLLGWWYSRGWAWALGQIFIVQTNKIASFFSITDLLKTLFAPFRQDAVNVKGAPISLRLQVLGENIISRFLGLLIRGVLIIVGLVVVLLNTALGMVVAVLWPTLPLSPFLAIVLLLQGASV